jgi:hypothetical protein
MTSGMTSEGALIHRDLPDASGLGRAYVRSMNERPSSGAVAGLILSALVLGFFGFLTGAGLAWNGYLPGPVSLGLLGWALTFAVLVPTLFIGGLHLLGRRS